jgi:hypothetical protein
LRYVPMHLALQGGDVIAAEAAGWGVVIHRERVNHLLGLVAAVGGGRGACARVRNAQGGARGRVQVDNIGMQWMLGLTQRMRSHTRAPPIKGEGLPLQP